MQQVVFLLLIGLVLIQADSLPEIEAYCIRECGSPEYDELVKELDHQDELLNNLVTRAVNVEHSLDQSKKEHDDADRESRNLLLRLDRLHSDKEHDICPKKHRRCLKGAARDGRPCVANILVCDGEPDCLDESDEDPELCKFPIPVGDTWYGHAAFAYCLPDVAPKNLSFRIDAVSRNSVIKSLTKIATTSFFSYRKVDGQVIHRTAKVEFMYNYATHTAKPRALFQGVSFQAELYFFPEENALYSFSYYAGTNERCSASKFTASTPRH